MEYLFIHQNFPGQYLRLAKYLSALPGARVMGVGERRNIENRGLLPGIVTVGYDTPGGAGRSTHHYLKPTEASVRRGQSVARSLLSLKGRGYRPDVVSVHPGWGEGLFVRDVFPDVPIVMFCEYFFVPGEADQAFDPEFTRPADWNFNVRVNNATQTLSLLTADRCISPTRWQASRYPEQFRRDIEVLHEGIDVDFMAPNPEAALLLQPLTSARGGLWGDAAVLSATGAPECATSFDPALACGDPVRLGAGDKVITYIARNLEPYRGFHILMRTLPDIQRRHPEARVLIVGGDGVSYSPPLPDGQSYKRRYLDEMAGRVDFSRVHFLGKVPYSYLRAFFQISAAHIYLTYPFVLSWSVLEAMAAGCLVIASDTEPVKEVLTHNETGLLADFFDQAALVDAVDAALSRPEAFSLLRTRAREHVCRHFHYLECMKKQAELLQKTAARGKHGL